MADSIRTLLHTLEGPRGKAEVYELEAQPSGGTVETLYEVVAGSERQRVRALGHAYIIAEEMAGVSK